MNERFVVAKGRLSYKRHGRNGWAWFVVDTKSQGTVARADDRAVAEADASRRNAGEVPA